MLITALKKQDQPNGKSHREMFHQRNTSVGSNKVKETTNIVLMETKNQVAMAMLLRTSQPCVFTTEIQPVVWLHPCEGT